MRYDGYLIAFEYVYDVCTFAIFTETAGIFIMLSITFIFWI